MTEQPKFVAVTTIREGNVFNQGERIRSEVALDTADNLRTLQIPYIAIYDECSETYLRKLKELGVIAIPQLGRGMGVVRREAIQAGPNYYPQATHYLWLEPEKPSIPFHAISLVETMNKEKTALGLFNRTSLESYPREQAFYYWFCRIVASKLLGFDLDYAFGPMVLTPESIPYFLNYSGEYGDLWDSILIPRLRVIKSSRITINQIHFLNDPRMTAVEWGNPRFILKRIRQLSNVAPSLVREWQRLKEL